MTGLPEKAARTTGTVAVAKWGRVTMISPRAPDRGYPWLDTLAHEMTHLALSRGTRDKAPLWLQEGVAKREETRWRIGEPLDDVPAIDAVAAVGIEKGLGRSLDQLGPSIAMLPTAEQAQVAFAEVQSFVRFYIKERGDDALPDLVRRLRDEATAPNFVEQRSDPRRMSGLDFVGWDKKWRRLHLRPSRTSCRPTSRSAGEFPKPPRGLAADAASVSSSTSADATRPRRRSSISKAQRHRAVRRVDPRLPRRGARGVRRSRQSRRARRQAGGRCTASSAAGGRSTGLFLDGRGDASDDPAAALRAFRVGISLDPLDRAVACEEKTAPELPKGSAHRRDLRGGAPHPARGD